MALILSIESSTEVCSVAIARDGEVLALRESVEGRDHSRLLAMFVDELLKESGLSSSQLDAVAVSMGPGSYTGLRIGVSLAKGLCYGLNTPLLGVGSLEALVAVAREKGVAEGATLCPMIDARRMEVYTQIFRSESITPIEAKIIDEESFSEYRDGGEFVIFGDGAAKCAEVLPWAMLMDVAPSASGVARVAEVKFKAGEREDVAYFEPFYLKDVVITKSKKRYF